MSPIGDIKPTTESQTRPLARLATDQQRIAWQKAVETAPDGEVTAAETEKNISTQVQKRNLCTIVQSEHLAYGPKSDQLVTPAMRYDEIRS